jgi:hypothetical protein
VTLAISHCPDHKRTFPSTYRTSSSPTTDSAEWKKVRRMVLVFGSVGDSCGFGLTAGVRGI